MRLSQPLRSDEFQNGVSQDVFANPDGSHTCLYDSNQINQGSSEHLGDPSWYETDLDTQHYISNVAIAL